MFTDVSLKWLTWLVIEWQINLACCLMTRGSRKHHVRGNGIISPRGAEGKSVIWFVLFICRSCSDFSDQCTLHNLNYYNSCYPKRVQSHTDLDENAPNPSVTTTFCFARLMLIIIRYSRWSLCRFLVFEKLSAEWQRCNEVFTHSLMASLYSLHLCHAFLRRRLRHLVHTTTHYSRKCFFLLLI